MESIYQSRGFASCLKQGFTCVLANPLTMLKVMWGWILVSAVVDVVIWGLAERLLADVLRGSLGVSTYVAYACIIGMYMFGIFLGLAGLVYFCRYMVRREEKKFKVKKSKIIFRNFWSFLGIFLMSGFLGGILALIPVMPYYVSSGAYTNSVMSEMVYHDNFAIPTSGYVVMFVLSVIAISICEFLGLVSPASLMYKYGSVVCNEQKNKD